MKLNIKMEGMDIVINNLKGLDKSVTDDVQKALTEGADIITRRTKGNIASTFKRKTGNLASSPVTKEMPQKEGWALVSVSAIDRKKAPHAHLHEYGTSRIPARPFLRPAFDSSKGEIEGLINNALADSVRRHT